MKTTRLRVTMRDVVPAVVRVIDVPAASTLPELHHLLQAALGWTDSHLHQFVAGETTYGVPDEDSDEEEQDEAGARLRDLPAAFTYSYDFGDGWEHDVEVLGLGGDEPGCVYGEGRCPPEDCGGPGGYADLLAVLADPSHDDHDRLREWAGELPEFDQPATDTLVRLTVGEVPASVRLVLDLLAPGVKLTPGGRLPRVFVRTVQAERPSWYRLDRPASVEEDLYPLTILHDLLRDVGLARLRSGVLSPTKAAGDDLEVIRRLCSFFKPRAFATNLIIGAVALLAAGGPQPAKLLAAAIHPLLSYTWSTDGRPITEEEARMELHGVVALMEALDLVETEWDKTIRQDVWQAGPSALSLLPDVIGLVAYFAREEHE
ncbi:MAG: plasmid pRiA4b ORF-3 family protein [Pseudonocardiales bacterium]|nr:MAG: plasmid pRiA4b ORF-3 family protein [Pseudonocardiales bacterium]